MDFNSGDIVELPIYANMIPPGRYRFVEIDGEIIVLSVARDIIIGLSKMFWGPFLQKVNEEKATPMTTWTFVRKYSRARAKHPNPSGSRNPERITFCLMSPRYDI